MITLKELKSKIDKNARLIGLDLGKKRIGVSICDHKRIIATPFKTIKYVDHENFITELLEIIDQENIKAIVVGNPLNMDGSKGPSSQSALDKANKINLELEKNNIEAIIDDTDENFSSKIKKMNLIGAPYQIIIGKKSEGDLLEFKETGSETQNLPLNKIIEIITKQKNSI